jgi:hypothetical protein
MCENSAADSRLLHDGAARNSDQHQFPEILVELREVFKKGYAVMAVREQERWRAGGGEIERLDHSFSATKARALVNLNFSPSALAITSLDELAYPRG